MEAEITEKGTNQMETQLPIEKNNTRKSAMAGMIFGAFAILALVFLGMMIERSSYQEPLPANQKCLEAIDLASRAFAGEQVDLHSAIQACKANQDSVEVKVK